MLCIVGENSVKICPCLFNFFEELSTEKHTQYAKFKVLMNALSVGSFSSMIPLSPEGLRILFPEGLRMRTILTEMKSLLSSERESDAIFIRRYFV